MENNNEFIEGLKGETNPPEQQYERTIRAALSEEEKKFSKAEIEDFNELLEKLNKEGGPSVSDLQGKEGLVQKIIIEYLNSVESSLHLKCNPDNPGAFREIEGEVGYYLLMNEKNNASRSDFTIKTLDFLKRCLSKAVSCKDKEELKDVSLRNSNDRSAETQVNLTVYEPDKDVSDEIHHNYDKMKEVADNINEHYRYGNMEKISSEGR